MSSLRVLVLGEDPSDPARLVNFLQSAGIASEAHTVSVQEDYLHACESFSPDVILAADSALQPSSVAEAFRTLRSSGNSAPFIRVSDDSSSNRSSDELTGEFVFNTGWNGLPAAIQEALRVRKVEKEASGLIQTLQQREERYALALRGSRDGLWDWNLDEQEVHFSGRWKEILGFSKEEVGRDISEWLGRIHPDDSLRVRSMIDSHLEGRVPHFECECRMVCKDGSWRWVLARGQAIRDSKGRAYRMTGTLTDISERKNFEQQLVHNTLHDPLTGLANRVLLMDRLGRSVERARRHPEYCFAVLFLDLDRFKLINDSLGHTVGDLLLAAVARRLEKILRPADTVCRMGGDEFVVLADDLADENDAGRVAARIEKALLQAFDVGGLQLFVSASIGIAPSRGSERPEDLMRHADSAMYRAKAQGRARTIIYDPAVHARAVTMMQMERDLQRALERHEFRLLYQPVLDLESLEIMEFEALVRWQHPENGLLTPPEFIPVAEEMGLMPHLGNWIIQQCCRDGRILHERRGSRPGFGISVNITSSQLSDRELIPFLARTMREMNIPPDLLRFEINESMILDNPDTAVQMLLHLRALKMKLYLDDFGTGQSSLGYLHRIPIDTLKIDRPLIRTMDQDAESREMVKTVILLGQNLGKKVIAEGVETEGQFETLKNWGCDLGQGFYFSRPMEFEAARTALTGRGHSRGNSNAAARER